MQIFFFVFFMKKGIEMLQNTAQIPLNTDNVTLLLLFRK